MADLTRLYHQSEGLVRLVARHDGIAADLGHKGTRGILQSWQHVQHFWLIPRIGSCATPPRNMPRK